MSCVSMLLLGRAHKSSHLSSLKLLWFNPLENESGYKCHHDRYTMTVSFLLSPVFLVSRVSVARALVRPVATAAACSCLRLTARAGRTAPGRFVHTRTIVRTIELTRHTYACTDVVRTAKPQCACRRATDVVGRRFGCRAAHRRRPAHRRRRTHSHHHQHQHATQRRTIDRSHQRRAIIPHERRPPQCRRSRIDAAAAPAQHRHHRSRRSRKVRTQHTYSKEDAGASGSGTRGEHQ